MGLPLKPRNSSTARLAGPLLAAGAALLLGACGSMTTYGTGTTAASQTMEDLTGVLALSPKKKEPIEYSARPPIVAPPVATALPPPGSETTGSVQAADWPVDPDEQRKKQDAVVAEMAESGQTPKFSIPGSENRPPPSFKDDKYDNAAERLRAQSLDREKTKKLFADAKMAKTGSVDEAGNPVRKYLTEPPVDYRAPDPESPVVITEKPKKKRTGIDWSSLWPF